MACIVLGFGALVVFGCSLGWLVSSVVVLQAASKLQSTIANTALLIAPLIVSSPGDDVENPENYIDHRPQENDKDNAKSCADT